MEEDKLEELDVELIKTRSVKGVTSLIGRSVLVQLVSSGGYFILTVILNLEALGIFAAVTEIVAILGYFSDIGLAAALIQKKSNPQVKDLRTTFTLQQILVISLILIVFLFSGSISSFYNLSQPGLFLLYSLLGGFFLASLKTIPSILLERSLRFEKLAVVELMETTIFYVVAIVLAKKGFGINSYSIAVLVRGIVGTGALYILCPWPIGLAISKKSLSELLKFGIPYQLNTFLAVIKDRLTNLILLKIIGAQGFAILNWSQTWAQKPLRFIMDNVTKVTFPMLARMQDDPKHLKTAIEKSLFYTCATIFPVLVAFSVFIKPTISLYQGYNAKWTAGIFPMYLYLFSAGWAAVSTPLTNALNAIGKIKFTFYLMIMWTVITLIISPLLAFKFGYIGVAYASAIIALTSIVPVIVTRMFVPFDLINSVTKPAITSLGMGIAVLIITRSLPGLLGIVCGLIAGITVYLSLTLFVCGSSVFKEAISFVKKK